MSEELVPLFPLNLVLYPRMPLTLHVFEERYKRMIARCLREERPFGVALIKEGVEVGGDAVPMSVGTLARIHTVERVEEGRMNLLAEGSERFRIMSFSSTPDGYLEARIELMQDAPAPAARAEELAGEIERQFREYFDLLVGHAGVDMPEYELPTEPEELSFVIASILDTEPEQRQTLLEMRDTVHRMEIVSALLAAELERVQGATDRAVYFAQSITAEQRRDWLGRN
jgi:Lon protease-like protein